MTCSKDTAAGRTGSGQANLATIKRFEQAIAYYQDALVQSGKSATTTRTGISPATSALPTLSSGSLTVCRMFERCCQSQEGSRRAPTGRPSRTTSRENPVRTPKAPRRKPISLNCLVSAFVGHSGASDQPSDNATRQCQTEDDVHRHRYFSDLR